MKMGYAYEHMKMGYAYERSHIPEVSRVALDSSSPGLKQSRFVRQEGEISKQQADHVYGKARLDNSPISSLSPPQFSVSSELHSGSGCEYQYDSDMYKGEISSSLHHASSGSSCVQESRRSASLITEISSSSHHASSGSSCVQESRRSASLITEISSSSHHASNGSSCVQEPWISAPLMEASVDSTLAYTKSRPDSDGKTMIHSLRDLESVLMGSDVDDADMMTDVGNEKGSTWGELIDLPANQQASPGLKQSAAAEETHQTRDGDPDALSISMHSLGFLKSENHVNYLLVACAAAISEEKMDVAECAMHDLKKIVSVYGTPSERLAAYMSEGLVARLQASGSTIYKALECREAPAVQVLSAMQKLFDICPYVKFAYMAANGAIAEAFKGEHKVHIFDFQIHQGMQWFSLIQALANRPGGAPYIRISTVDDPTFQAYPLSGMHAVKKRLSKLASSLGVPFEFTIISTKLSDLQAHMIERRPEEVLAMNFALQLHHMPDESVCLDNPRDRLLRMAKSLNPKVLTLIEQDANTNTAPFFARFMEILDYYSAVFESIDAALPRESKDRVNVEEHGLARDIVNVIACEGVQRVERHELAGKWRARMLMAGFKSRPLSLYVNNTIKSLLESYDEKYTLKEDGLVLLLGWLNRSLVAASAWH